MPRNDLLSELTRRPLLCDGAMGTQLIAAGLTPGSPGEAWNLDEPDAVEAIHRRYRQAGCDLITTNTFGGTTAALERHGLAGRADDLNRAGAAIARRAAGTEGWVLGDIGPFGGFLEPVGDMEPPALLAMFEQQAQSLKQGGADAVVVETMVAPDEMAIAIRAARAVGNWPIIATWAFNKADAGFRTIMGTTAAQAIAAALDAGADIVGANCGTGLSLDDYKRLAADLVLAARGKPVILQPNAGAPRTVGGKLVYDATPADMAALVKPLLEAGVKIIGGCCGTTPDQLAAMAAAMPQ